MTTRHHPSRRQFLQTASAAAVGAALLPRWGRAADVDANAPAVAGAGAAGEKKRLLFFTKSAGFEHSVIKRPAPDKLAYAEQILTHLGAEHGFDITCSKDGGMFAPEKMKTFDGFVFYTTGDLTTPGTDKQPPMSKEGKAAFLDAIKSGKGFVGLHSASDTFHSPGHKKPELVTNPEYDPYIQMLGGEFIVHGAQQKAGVKLIDPKFPGAPAQGWEMMEEWYSLKNFSPDLHVILVQETDGMKGAMYERKPYPETWARRHGKGRVFYSSMGHREDGWKNDHFLQLLIGALNWTTGRADADLQPNLDTAAPGAQLPKQPSGKSSEK